MRTNLIAIFITAAVFAGTACAEELGLEGFGTRWFSGGEIHRTLLTGKELSKQQNASVEWKLFVSKAAIKQNSVPFQGERTQIIIDVPAVKTKVSASLDVSILQNGKKIAGRVFEITIYPPVPTADLKAILEKTKLGLCDPSGDVKKIFDKAGVPFEELKSELAINSFSGQLLIVGSNAEEAGQFYPLGKLAQTNIAKGLKVLVLEQKKLVPDQKSQKLDAPEQAEKEVELLAPKHPVFKGMSAGNFTGWGADGIVIRYPLGDFSTFAYRPLSKMPGKRQNYSAPSNVIVELPVKQGLLLYCQLPIMEKFNDEPLAAVFFNNIMRYLCNPPESRVFKKVCAYGSEGDLINLQTMMDLDRKNPVDPPTDALLVLIPGEDYLGNLAARNPEQLRRIGNRVRLGATLVVMPLREKTGEQLRALLVDDSPAPIVKSEKTPIAPKLLESADCLTGLCQDDFAEMFRALAEEENKSQNSKFKKSILCQIEKAANDIELLSPGLIVKRQLGQGRVFFCQLSLDTYNSTAGKLVARLFWGNLINPLM